MKRLVREGYVAGMQKQLDKFKADIEKLNAKATAATTEIKAKLAEDVKTLREQFGSVEKKAGRTEDRQPGQSKRTAIRLGVCDGKIEEVRQKKPGLTRSAF